MIHLERLNEPDILRTRGAQWLQAFLDSGKDRPNNKQYGHDDVRKVLNSISHCKCFYCERRLKGASKEIDHYVEVSFDKTGAFVWNNLYLACNNCNDKLPHISISVDTVLDPFRNSNEEIEEHLTFNKEAIRIKNGSQKGSQTIRKFGLDSEELDLLRSKFLNEFYDEYSTIKDTCIKEMRQDMRADEKETLLKYCYPDHPFSLMFKVILRKKGIL